MAFQLQRASNGEQAVADSKDPMLRLFLVPKMRLPFELPQAWNESNPDSSPTFSAVGYFFGKSLRKALGVPVGLIDSSVGGTPAEAWTSRPCLMPHPELNGVARPYYLYNSMIAPLLPYGIRGAIWYQGEGNAPRAYAYRSLLPLMIKCWRDAWGEGDFPFLVVQLAPYGKAKVEATWPELREAQLYVTQTVPKTGLAVTMDVGNCENIHPTQKEPVGQRLALDAEALVYGKKVEYSGPAYDSMAVEETGGIILSFTHVDGGLTASGGELKGFTIAGEDKNFVPATAKIVGDQVIVSSPDVPNPVAVRYGWEDCPDANLANKAGLPASPFRTDDWGWITKPSER
jgi:sialate O-acetylesterase